MDGERHDPLDDDDVTVVGDHELVVELRRIAAAKPGAPGAALPPPALRGPAAPARAPLPWTGIPGHDEWWDEDEDEEPSGGVLRVALLAALVVAVAVAAVLILR
jgi:hypothetical protein